jgi:hypothetical protein
LGYALASATLGGAFSAGDDATRNALHVEMGINVTAIILVVVVILLLLFFLMTPSIFTPTPSPPPPHTNVVRLGRGLVSNTGYQANNISGNGSAYVTQRACEAIGGLWAFSHCECPQGTTGYVCDQPLVRSDFQPMKATLTPNTKLVEIVLDADHTWRLEDYTKPPPKRGRDRVRFASPLASPVAWASLPPARPHHGFDLLREEVCEMGVGSIGVDAASVSSRDVEADPDEARADKIATHEASAVEIGPDEGIASVEGNGSRLDEKTLVTTGEGEALVAEMGLVETRVSEMRASETLTVENSLDRDVMEVNETLTVDISLGGDMAGVDGARMTEGLDSDTRLPLSQASTHIAIGETGPRSVGSTPHVIDPLPANEPPPLASILDLVRDDPLSVGLHYDGSKYYSIVSDGDVVPFKTLIPADLNPNVWLKESALNSFMIYDNTFILYNSKFHAHDWHLQPQGRFILSAPNNTFVPFTRSWSIIEVQPAIPKTIVILDTSVDVRQITSTPASFVADVKAGRVAKARIVSEDDLPSIPPPFIVFITDQVAVSP